MDEVSLQEMLVALEKQKETERLRFYTPFTKEDTVTESSDSQMCFHKSNVKERWLIAGNRSGKTVSGAAEACLFALGEDGDRYWGHLPKECREKYSGIKTPNDGWVVASDHNVQKEASQKWIFELLPREFIEDTWWVRNGICNNILLTNGSDITFKSSEAGQKSFEGAAKRWIWFDEEPVTEGVYNECVMRESGKFPLHMWGTMTPARGVGFTHERVFEVADEMDDMLVMSWATMDNPYISDDIVESIKIRFKHQPKELQRRLYGKYIEPAGLVYPSFSEERNVIEPFTVPPDWPIYEAIDLGFANPSAVMWLVVSPENIKYVIDELYEAKLSVPVLAEKIKNKRKEGIYTKGPYKPVLSLIDPSSQKRQQPLDDRLVDEQSTVTPRKVLRQHGVYTKLADNSVLQGIENVRSELNPSDGNTRIKVFSNCVNFIREITHYRLDEHASRKTESKRNPKEKPKKKDDHLMDDLRYVINEGVRYFSRDNLRKRSGKQKTGSFSKTGY